MELDLDPKSYRHAADELDLQPMKPLDLRNVRSTNDLLAELSGTAFTGRTLGEAVDVAAAMFEDDTYVVLTLSGAMTMAGLNRLIMEMLERRWVHCIVSTGALVGHGLIEDLGGTHYKARADIRDEEYFARRLNRVYDTIEPEINLDDLEYRVRSAFRDLAAVRKEPLGTAELLAHLGKELPGEGVLQTSARLDVPVFIPAFTDCELGIDFAIHVQRQQRAGCAALVYDGIRDVLQFADLCESALRRGQRLGIFTIGGGVPRNWAQQVGPYIDCRNKRIGRDSLGLEAVRYTYGVRICPDPVHYGHLSGCTYQEGVSWGKFVPRSEGGRHAEVLLDATVGWPLIVQALIERGL